MTLYRATSFSFLLVSRTQHHQKRAPKDTTPARIMTTAMATVPEDMLSFEGETGTGLASAMRGRMWVWGCQLLVERVGEWCCARDRWCSSVLLDYSRSLNLILKTFETDAMKWRHNLLVLVAPL